MEELHFQVSKDVGCRQKKIIITILLKLQLGIIHI